MVLFWLNRICLVINLVHNVVQSTKEALKILSVTSDTLSSEQRAGLDRDGFCLIEFSQQEWKERGVDLDKISSTVDDLIEKEGWKGGWEHISETMVKGVHPEPGSQRLNNLLNKGSCFSKIFTIPEVLDASYSFIKNDMCLSSMILRAPQPNNERQKLHIDWVPRKKESDPYRSVVCTILLDDATKESGATRFVPGSHKLLGAPSDHGYGNKGPHPEEKLLEAPRGSFLMYSAHLWHGGTECKNGKPRRQIFINYRDRKVWQSLNMKKFLSLEYTEGLNEAEKYLLKIRPEDPSQMEWLFKRRNNKLVKVMSNFLWNLRDKKHILSS